MAETISFLLNGRPVSLRTDPLRRLLDVLREDFGLTGTKEGCGQGECGACAVLMDGRLVNSCLLPLIQVQGREILTIEGFREMPRFEVLSRCFSEAGAVQCGFCTPGMLLAAEALLRRDPSPKVWDIRQALSGNLCRCTGYDAIIRAVAAAGREGGAG
ncbi:MAG: (2Fe-2S)-binding protein [Christensenellales bacterium]